MTGILKNFQMAWLGWKSYTDGGKIAALLLAALFFLWYYRKKEGNLPFLAYTTVTAICCIFPVTAAILMIYQTKFYDYEWLWSLVPVTAAIAYGIVLLLAECWDGFQISQWRKGLPVTVLLLAVILLAGGMGRPAWDRAEQAKERQQAYGILDEIMELCPEGELCLWAPQEIMAYARERDSHIRLPYGRNMWDNSLNAWAYDTYDERTTALYQWMEQAGKAEVADGVCVSLEESIQYARDIGVDCIVLPETISQETIRKMETALDVKARLLEGYWIFYGQAD